jgi:hypothetical protein
LPDTKEKLVALGTDPVLNTPEQFTAGMTPSGRAW